MKLVIQPSRPGFLWVAISVAGIIVSLGRNLGTVFDRSLVAIPGSMNEVEKSSSHSDQIKDRVDGRIAVFFNTYRPVGTDHRITARASRIIRSQLDMIRAQPLLSNSTVYYTRVGDYTSLPNDFEEYCSKAHHEDGTASRMNGTHGSTDTYKDTYKKLQCVEIASQAEGDEHITLQAMYDYCTQNGNDKVVYLHSKGTYTTSEGNDRLRTFLMKAILSDECLLLKSPDNVSLASARHDADREDEFRLNATAMGTDDVGRYRHHQCDACSGQFSLWPFSSYPGNMFVARCSYVRTLIPPTDFERKKRALVERLHNATVVHGRDITATVHRTSLSTLEPTAPNSSFIGHDDDNRSKRDAVAIEDSERGNYSGFNETVEFHFLKSHDYQFYRESWLGSK